MRAINLLFVGLGLVFVLSEALFGWFGPSLYEMVVLGVAAPALVLFGESEKFGSRHVFPAALIANIVLMVWLCWLALRFFEGGAPLGAVLIIAVSLVPLVNSVALIKQLFRHSVIN